MTVTDGGGQLQVFLMWVPEEEEPWQYVPNSGIVAYRNTVHAQFQTCAQQQPQGNRPGNLRPWNLSTLASWVMSGISARAALVVRDGVEMGLAGGRVLAPGRIMTQREVFEQRGTVRVAGPEIILYVLPPIPS